MPHVQRRAITTILLALLSIAGLQACLPHDRGPSATELVELNQCIPDIVLDIRYATANNFTGKVVYPEARCFLAREAAEALREAQSELKKQGYRLKVFDGYRPLSVQRIFWEILPDPRYVADPSVGSKHNRGYAVDVSLVTLDGGEVAMPTEFDDFTERAHSGYMDLPEDAVRHRAILHDAMKKHGFTPFDTEWWHFDYRGWQNKPILDIPFEDIPAKRTPPHVSSSASIPDGRAVFGVRKRACRHESGSKLPRSKECPVAGRMRRWSVGEWLARGQSSGRFFKSFMFMVVVGVLAQEMTQMNADPRPPEPHLRISAPSADENSPRCLQMAGTTLRSTRRAS